MEPIHPYDPYGLFQATVERYPDHVALHSGDSEWTYRELEEHAAAIAGWCVRNTPKNARIAVHVQKELTAYAGILGILRAGRSYVPLHPDHPPARWHSVMEQAGVSACIMSSSTDRERVGEFNVPILSEWTSEEPASIIPGSEAYVMFTSGSTGGPKGVPVTRSNVAAYLEHMLSRYHFTAEDRFSQLFALTFDLSVHDLFVCWGAGACLCVPEDDSALRMSSYLEKNGITSWFSVPSLAALMRRMRVLKDGALPTLKHSFFCGEALSWEVANAWKRAAINSTVVNLYGPTEATIAITEFEVTDANMQIAGTVPLGRTVGKNRAMIVPSEGSGEGELHVCGPQVTNGYSGRPEETARAFKKLVGEVGTWYATGDLVRSDAGGVFHFLGRIDDQVKVLGHRVEPAEVDSILAPFVRPGNVITLPVTNEGITRLVTFIDMEMDTAPLMSRLRDALPTYMLPDGIHCVNGFPTTAHGKVDRAALIELATHGRV